MFPFRGTLREPLAASFFSGGTARLPQQWRAAGYKSEWQEWIVSGCDARVVLVVVVVLLLPSLLRLLLLVGG